MSQLVRRSGFNASWLKWDLILDFYFVYVVYWILTYCTAWRWIIRKAKTNIWGSLKYTCCVWLLLLLCKYTGTMRWTTYRESYEMELAMEWTAKDLENFILDHHIIQNRSAVHSIRWVPKACLPGYKQLIKNLTKMTPAISYKNSARCRKIQNVNSHHYKPWWTMYRFLCSHIC